MRLSRFSFIAILLVVTVFDSLSAQTRLSKSSAAILMIPEPAITMGTSNRVYSEEIFGVKTFLYKTQTATEWDTIASSGNPSQYSEDIGGLQSGVIYQYRVLFAGDLSTIVSSMQDNVPPQVAMNLAGSYFNRNSFFIPFSTQDALTKSVKKAYLYYRPNHNDPNSWRLIVEQAINPTREASSQHPLSDSLLFVVPDTLGDGAYEFYLAAQDTAWSPVHRPDQPFTGSEGNLFVPINGTVALKQVFVDLHAPFSRITTVLPQFSNSVAMPIQFSAQDSISGHNNYHGSGINKISLFVSYKSDSTAGYVYHNVLDSSIVLDSPLFSMNGAFNFIADRDGYYEFYTLTADTAHNRENNWAPKVTGLPHVFVDSSIPKLRSILLQEITPVDALMHPAKPGWTKTTQIRFTVAGAKDVAKNGFAAGVDSLFLAENDAFDQNLALHNVPDSTVSGVYQLTSLPGAKTVFARVIDRADNSSLPIMGTITYDPQAPTISQFSFPFRVISQYQTSVSAIFNDDHALDSLYLWLNDILISTSALPAQNHDETIIPIDLPDRLGWHVLKTQIRDRAGNVSTIASDSVKIVNTVVLSGLQLADLADPSDLFIAPDAGYSDSAVVQASLHFDGILLKLQYSADPAFTVYEEKTPPWNVITSQNGDTTIQQEYRFTGNDGAKTLYVRGFGPQLTDTSNVVQASIIVDTQNPVLANLAAYHVLAPQDTTFGFTNSRTVRVKTISTDAELSKLLLWENGQDSSLYLTYAADTVYTLRTPDDGAIRLNATIRDRAGNWSTPRQVMVYLDRRLPLLDSLYFTKAYVSGYRADIHLTAKDDTLYSRVGELEKVRFSEKSDFPAGETQTFALPAQVNYAGDFAIDLSPVYGEHTVYAQVRDRAGNWSSIQSARIKVVQVVQPQAVALTDITPPTQTQDIAFPGWSDHDSVQVQLNFRGILAQILVTRDPAFVAGTQAVANWVAVNDSTVNFFYKFDGAEGWANLWINLLGPNLTDTSRVIQGSIHIDKTKPVLSGVTVYQVQAAGDTLFAYTNSDQVQVDFKAPTEALTHALLWEAGVTPVFSSLTHPGESYRFATPTNEVKTVFVAVRDSAGNWSADYQDAIILDSRPPLLDSLYFTKAYVSGYRADIHLTAKDDTLYSRVGELEKVRFSEKSDFPAGETQTFALPAQVNYAGDFAIDLSPVYGEHTVYAQVRDRAGNWSSIQSARIKVVQVVQPQAVALTDITPPTQTQDIAFPGWSDHDSVQVQLNFRGILAQILVTRDPAFVAGTQAVANWVAVNDSTVNFFYKFDGAEGWANLWINLLGPNLTDTSRVIQGSIHIDKTKPVLSGVTVYQVQAAGDTLFAYTNSDQVQVDFKAPTEALTHALLWEAGVTPVFSSLTHPGESYRFATPTNEVKTVFVAVRDSAGNWSADYQDAIILDTLAPNLSTVVLSDTTQPGDSDSTLTDDMRIEVTLQTTELLPGHLQRILIAQNAALTANLQAVLFSSPQVSMWTGKYRFYYEAKRDYMINNKIVCWLVVQDSAGNRSQVVSDDILLTEKLAIASSLYDARDLSDSLFSATPNVILQVREVSGIFQEIAFSEQKGELNNWQSASMGEVFTANYTLSSSLPYFVGKLYIAARNSAGQFALDSTTITVDQIPPQVDSMLVLATIPSRDQEYTNSRQVKVFMLAHDIGVLKEIHLSEDSLFTLVKFVLPIPTTSSYQNEVDFELSPDNGVKTVFVRFVDMAENISRVRSDVIIADYDPMFTVTNHPNPFDPAIEPTTIIVKTDALTAIEVNIYDLFGNLVRKIETPAGEHYNQILWDGNNGKGELVANGGYLCVVKVGTKTMMRKIAVIK